MKNKFYNFIKIAFGLFIFSIGIVISINANLGLSPWDVFHEGLSKTSGMTMGMAVIISGFVVIIINISLGENIGWGTLMDTLLTGTFIDILMLNNLVPIFNGLLPRFIMLFLSLLIQGVGVCLYLSAELGAGPKDGLMVALTKKTGKPVRLVKSFIEVIATILGYILGGSIGIGTLIMAIMGGQFFQLVFKIFKFDLNLINNRYISDDMKLLKEKLKTYR